MIDDNSKICFKELVKIILQHKIDKLEIVVDPEENEIYASCSSAQNK